MYVVYVHLIDLSQFCKTEFRQMLINCQPDKFRKSLPRRWTDLFLILSNMNVKMAVQFKHSIVNVCDWFK